MLLRSSFSLLVLAASVNAQDDDARHGIWRAADGSRTLLLEEGRAGWLVDGEPAFFRVAAGEGDELVFESWGRLTTYDVRFDEGGLRVEGGGIDGAFERVKKLPDAMRVDPYELPEAKPMDPELVAMLTEELAARREEDQRVRSDQAGAGEMQRVDEDNTEFVRNVVLELGWIDAERFGEVASNAAFLIVQHTSDTRLMRTALPFVEADVRAGKMSGQTYALMYDRLQLRLGYRQRYGSQIGVVDGESVLMPCEDIDRVDELRAEMGMGKLETYLDYFREEGDPPIRHIGS